MNDTTQTPATGDVAMAERKRQGTESGEPPESPVAVDAPPATKWTSISTSEGRGADAMVQSGTSEIFATKPSFGIRRRGGVDTNHSYLRFDLASIEDVRRYADSAELLLTIVGDERPAGSEIRLYGVEGLGMWPELRLEWKRSYSAQGLEQLPLLAEVSVTDVPDAENPRIIRIASDKLAKFIATSGEDLITVALAGSGVGNEFVRFVSGDSSPADAPKLRVQTLVQPPPEDKQKQGRNR